MKSKRYATIDDIPHDKLDAIVELLRQDKKTKAETVLRALLSRVNDATWIDEIRLAQQLLQKAREECD